MNPLELDRLARRAGLPTPAETSPQIAQEPSDGAGSYSDVIPAGKSPHGASQPRESASLDGPGPADRLRAAAERIEQTAAATAADPWAQPYTRATLVPWVALMDPQLGPLLAAVLRADADAIDEIQDQFGEGTVTAAEWPALAVADHILNQQKGTP